MSTDSAAGTDDPAEVLRRLLAARRPVADVRADGPGDRVPPTPGFYAFWVKDPGVLPGGPAPLVQPDREVGDTASFLYFGIARGAAGLRDRVLGTHLGGAIGSSTFRYAIAALLWEREDWKPQHPKDRVVLSADEEAAISRWQDEHLLVAWVEHPSPRKVEREVLRRYGPPLNIEGNAGNPFRRALVAARAAMRAEARGHEPAPARGHLFVTRGDLTRLACDAVLAPSGIWPEPDGRPWHVRNEVWWPLLGDAVDRQGFVTIPDGEGARPDVALARVARVADAQSGDGATDRAPAVWVAHTGESGQTAAWHAAAVGDFVREAGNQFVPTPPGAWRPLGDERPLLAVPLVGTGHGGAAARKDDTVVEVIRAIWEAQADTVADVVLVLADDNALAAAQQARRVIEGFDPFVELDEPQRLLAERLGRDARDGALVPFVGAGAGIGAGLPSWSELLRELADKAGLDVDARDELSKLDVRDQAQILRHEMASRAGTLGTAAVNAYIAERTGDSHPRLSVVHQLLATMPVSEVVTTNYDLCLEQAFRDADRSLARLGDGTDRGDGWLLKMHGSADRPESIVLSREDYLRFEGDGVALAGVVQAMLLTRHLLFVGYSLSDDNFHRLVHQAGQVGGAPGVAAADRRLQATALTPEPLGLAQRIWEGRIAFESTADEGRMDPRRLAILLDAVAAEAASVTTHLRDETYEHLFTPAELEVGKQIEALEEAVGKLDGEREKAVRSALRSALDRLRS